MQKSRVVLIDVIDPHTHKDDAIKNLKELKQLVSTFNGTHVVDIIQHKNMPDKATFIGSGKVDELLEIVVNKKVDIVVINAIVKPGILFNLTQKLWNDNPDIQVWDRIDLILNIFDRHAVSSEAKLQIEIARMHHMGQRIYGLGKTYFSRQAGGIGMRGQGETNIEVMKRHFKSQILKKTQELKKLERQHKFQIERRKSNNIQSVSIVGYTNAGKTSLFNLLTKKKQVVRNALFVTLDSITGRLYLPLLKREVLVTDTIGFIKDLPSSLIESFKSTLTESIHADLVVHVIDIADEEMEKKIKVVEEILHEIKAGSQKMIYVFNKVDAFTGDAEKILKKIKNKYCDFTPQFISVKENFGLEKLISHISKSL